MAWMYSEALGPYHLLICSNQGKELHKAPLQIVLEMRKGERGKLYKTHQIFLIT